MLVTQAPGNQRSHTQAAPQATDVLLSCHSTRLHPARPSSSLNTADITGLRRAAHRARGTSPFEPQYVLLEAKPTALAPLLPQREPSELVPGTRVRAWIVHWRLLHGRQHRSPAAKLVRPR